MSMTKAERKNILLIIESHLSKGIKSDDKNHIIEAYKHLEYLLSDAGVFRLSEFPKFPDNW